MDRRRPIGLPRTRSTFADGFYPPEHPPLRRDPFDKFQNSIPSSYNRFRDGISDPSMRMFNDDDDMMFFDNFPRRPFYTEPEFFNAQLPRNEEPPSSFFQSQLPREPVPPPHHHQRSKSHYDNVADGWDRPQSRQFHGESDEQQMPMPFEDQQQQHHLPQSHNRPQQQQQQHHQPPNDPNVHVIKIHHEGRRQPPVAPAGRENMSNNGNKFVEINNSVPNYEVLNPDKRRRRSNSRKEGEDEDNNSAHNTLGNHANGGHRRSTSIPNIIIDDFSTYTADEKDATSAAIPLPAPAIPLPAPQNMMAQNVKNDVQQEQQNMIFEHQKNSLPDVSPNIKNVVVVVDCANNDDDGKAAAVRHDHDDDGHHRPQQQQQRHSDQIYMQKQRQINEAMATVGYGSGADLLQLVDETEHLTEQLRENALKLEQEKETILNKINNITKASAGVKLTTQFSQAERDGMMLNLQRILARCNTVNVSIETPRDQHQSKALDQVNKMIQSVVDNANGNVGESKLKIYGFLNACHPDEIGHIDEKFQSAIIECTADDQKKTRRKLAHIVEQMRQLDREKMAPKIKS